MQLPQNRHQPMLVDGLLPGGQRLAGPQLLQYIVHARQGQIWVQFLLALAVGVELFGQGADFLFLVVAGVRKGERLETAGLDIDRIVADTQPAAGRQRPGYMVAAREHTQDKCVVAGNGH